MNHKITQKSVEESLPPSTAKALDIIRNNPNINRYEALLKYGHGSLSQRYCDLKAKGFIFAVQPDEWQGHVGVAHYTLLGWAVQGVLELA